MAMPQRTPLGSSAMPRREFSPKIMVEAFKRAGGKCQRCTARLSVGKFAYDHVIPDALGGEPTLENCEVLCTSCHGVKTNRTDIPTIAKVKRVKINHIGARHSSSPMPGSKASRWRKPMRGPAVLR